MRKSSIPKHVKLTTVTVNYNSAQLTLGLISSIKKSVGVNFGIKIIVVDNSSTDKSVEKLSRVEEITFISNVANRGFAYGNNLALPSLEGDYIWFLNPDTAIGPNTVAFMVRYMDTHPDVGMATPKLVLPSGELDKNCHRGFPGLWNSLCHFLNIDRIFPKSRIFSTYYLGYLPADQEAEVDVIGGSSVLIRKQVGDKVGWWDESYFMYGEDIELAYQVKQLGYKVMYVPQVSITHYHGASSGVKRSSREITTADIETRRRSARATTQAMRIFYQKHYASSNPFFVNWIVSLGIWLMERIRLISLSV